ncbi:hypothetical protein QQ045_004241 [Rhodiola kirilowii]
MAAHAYEELIAWHLHDKVFTLTLDNASSNDVLVSRLACHLMLSNATNQLFHVRCTCHILNLIVQDGLSILSPSTEKITTIVRSMNSSIKRHELWVSSCAELGLNKRNIDNDVPHRNCSIDVPSDHDWVIASLCMNFLKIFCTTTKVCSGVYSPTSNKVINSLVDIYATFKAYHPLDAFRPTLVAMKLKFNKYWVDFPMIFCLATFMDPRFKLLAIESWLSLYDLSHIDIEIKVASVRAVLHQLYDTYKRNMIACMPTACTNMPVASDAFEPEIDVNIPVVPSASMAKLKRARVSNSGASTDLQMYLDLDTLDMDEKGNFNVLEWWKANSSMYPVLSLMARDLLSIPTSTVASEAAFSAGGRVVSEKMASLSPNTI